MPPGLVAGRAIAAKYELVTRLGAGTMGEVWAARHQTLDEDVAIKLVVKDVNHEDGSSSASRFLLEARVAAALSRKTRHIVSVTDHGEDGELAYLVMERLSGESLEARLARSGPKSLESVAPILQQIARALAVAHAEGVVHRDLKPSNVFVTVDEEGEALVKVLDFGIAKLRASTRHVRLASMSDAKHATMHGFLLGTPAYMSPEQARGHAGIDHRADVWALGVIAYHLLTNEYPFDAETPEALLARILRADAIPVQLHRPDLPEIVGDFFRRAFAARIGERFQSALALAGSFEQLVPLASKGTISAPPPRPAPLAEVPLPTPRSLRTIAGSSMVAAGVPKPRDALRVVAALALVASVLATTTALVSIALERDPEVRPATIVSASAPPPRAAEVPSPPPPEEAPSPSSIAVDALPALREASQVRPRAAPAPTVSAPPATATATATPAVAPVRRIDKGEIL